MLPISDADEDLFATAVAAVRIGRVGAIIERLRTRYDEEWDDPLAGLPYAMAMLAVLLSGRADLLKEMNYTDIVETLGDVLHHQPDHWLSRYLRIHARVLLPDGEYALYIAAERSKAVADAEELIERQSRTAWQPWFASTYLVAARLAWQSERKDRDRVAALVTAAAARPCAPIRFPSLGSVMCGAFLWYRAQPELPERDTVRAMMEALFPGQPAVRRQRASRIT